MYYCNIFSCRPTGISHMENQSSTYSLHSGENAQVTGQMHNCKDQNSQSQKRKSGQGWYARLSDEKKAEYLQRQRIARQKKKAATSADVNYVQLSQISVTPLTGPQRTPLSNITNTHTNGTYTCFVSFWENGLS